MNNFTLENTPYSNMNLQAKNYQRINIISVAKIYL